MSTLQVNTINAATSGQAVAVDVENPRSFRNLVINGAMNVAQRGTSTTTSTGYCADRFMCLFDGTNESPTFEQHALTSSDTGPWEKGFRNSLHVTNGNQSSGAGSNDYIAIDYRLEAQDVANSGWDYTSSSSYITISYWVKSSVAQNFYVTLKTDDGTSQNYGFETGSLSANTWTKITKSIPGHSNLQFDNNNAEGLRFRFVLFRGTDKTTSGYTLNTWGAYSNTARMPDNTSTWYTTNDATWEITGVQVEVGSYATDFEHRSYGEELARCQRYYEAVYMNAGTHGFQSATSYGGQVSNNIFAVTKRAQPSFSLEGDASWVGTTPNAFTDKHNFIFHHGSTAYTMSDSSQHLCGSFSCEI